MKKLHLLCNAHIDPAWLWHRNEGLMETLSTFRVAAEFCENYDGFIFNHNEALLYEWVEESEPELFEHIKKLVKDGKWIIMGGWYLQPDCVMTSGESLLEQIRLGREYFKEKFDITPTTAINFDPFGHSRGLVQILKKTGFDSYIFMRPYEITGDFIWEGFDGSQIFAHGIYGEYRSLKGEVIDKIMQHQILDSAETGLCLWGIGDHGGGPSKIDLESINTYIQEADLEVLHSSAERYVSEVGHKVTKVITSSLGPCMVGCYTSMVKIKQGNRRLENSIALTEKLLTYAHMFYGYNYDEQKLNEAKKALAFCQFHDILPGSSIKSVEEDSLRTQSYADELLDLLHTKAFLKLCDGQRKGKNGEIPIMVFNPHPYEIEKEFEVEFLLEGEQKDYAKTTIASVYDENGNFLPTQNEKPECTFNNDWVKKISFRGKLAPSSMNRFDCKLTLIEKSELQPYKYKNDCIEFSDEHKLVRIGTNSGLIEHYEVNGKLIIKNSGRIEVYKDYEDPWGMKVSAFDNYEGEFKLMSSNDANTFIGYPEETLQNVRVIEFGAVRTIVQAIFEYGRSIAVLEYTIPKNDTYIDVNITLYSNDVNKMIKYKLDTEISGTPVGETAFGRETLNSQGQEAVYHKWCGIENETERVYVANKGTYGGSFTEKSIGISLLRTPVYAAHPLEDRQIAPHDRFLKHIDMGERNFSFRITTEPNIAREAQIFNEAPRLVAMFPSGEGKRADSAICIDNPSIILSSIKKIDNGYAINLFNSSGDDVCASVLLKSLNKKLDLDFKGYELKMIEI